MPQTLLSPLLIAHVQELYNESVKALLDNRYHREGINGFTLHAFPGYVLAIASIEAFLNETFFSGGFREFLSTTALWRLDQEWLEKLDLRHKLILVPHLLFGKTIGSGSALYRDFKILNSLRNDVVHYKADTEPKTYLKELDKQRVTFRKTDSGFPDYSWQDKVASSECLRWAHNTACKTVHALNALIPEPLSYSVSFVVMSFRVTPASLARRWLIDHHIDPHTSNDARLPSG
jgi:hypothetical protein